MSSLPSIIKSHTQSSLLVQQICFSTISFLTLPLKSLNLYLNGTSLFSSCLTIATNISQKNSKKSLSQESNPSRMSRTRMLLRLLRELLDVSHGCWPTEDKVGCRWSDKKSKEKLTQLRCSNVLSKLLKKLPKKLLSFMNANSETNISCCSMKPTICLLF